MNITVTAGHGGGDPGAVYGGLREADLMAELRDLVAANLRESGHNVRTDGEGAINQALTYALQLIAGSDAAIELHTNAASNPAATGVEVVSLPSQMLRAQRLARAIANTLGLRLRGRDGWIDQTSSARGRLGFVARGGMVVEVFFLSNPADLSAYLGKKNSVAFAIATALSANYRS